MRTALIGLLLVVVFAVAFAPATLLTMVFPAEGGVELLQPQGTLWEGNADLYLAGQPAGQADWDFQPASLLRGRLGYQLRLAGPDHSLQGLLSAGFGAARVDLAGRLGAGFANQWLGAYDIAITGDLALEDVQARIPYDFRASGDGTSSGSLRWAGGPVRYRLAGRDFTGELPPLVAYLGDALEAVVYPEEGETPLLNLRVMRDGFVSIGVTQLLTRLAGNPWPGSHADHEVVLEVEEQLF